VAAVQNCFIIGLLPVILYIRVSVRFTQNYRKEKDVEDLYTRSKITPEDQDEIIELRVFEGLTGKEARDHILRRKEAERMRKLNDHILLGIGGTR
tara:strand:+ start:264 stop:548 length:285 start_codon:yes stop_codon:yes gene_type:complete